MNRKKASGEYFQEMNLRLDATHYHWDLKRCQLPLSFGTP
jgi:hypothetical protein